MSDNHSTESFKATLLGTGGPELSVDRAGAATLIEAGDQMILIDAGRNVLQRLYECGKPIAAITKVIFTHLHSDHIEGLPNLWMTSWFMLGRKIPMTFYGPKGTGNMIAGMQQFLASDLVTRANDSNPTTAQECNIHEFDGRGTVYDEGGLRITSVPVDHKAGNPSFGFLVDFGGRRLIISGDCTFSEDLAESGPADVVVHNVFGPTPAYLATNRFKRAVSETLASPEQAGEVFRRTNAKLGVFTHVIRLDSTCDDMVARAKSIYQGPIVTGEDRMVVEVAATPSVIHSNDISDLPELNGRSGVVA